MTDIESGDELDSSPDLEMHRIAYFLVMNGPSHEKMLEKRLKMNKAAISRAIRRLVDTKRIVIHHTEKSGRVKYYNLTRLGAMDVFWFAYEEADENPTKVRALVRDLFARVPNWLPDIAPLWPAITQVTLEELAIWGVVDLCERAFEDYYRNEKGLPSLGPNDPCELVLSSWLQWLGEEILLRSGQDPSRV